MDIRGKIAVITGGASGIGRATAIALAKEGADLVLADINDDRLEEARKEIPLPGRIMALVDAYSAMILDRPYRKALTHEEAVAELRRNAGTQLAPELVEPFISLLESQRQAAA